MKRKSLILILPVLLMIGLFALSAAANELELVKGKVKIRSKGSDMIYDKPDQKILIFNGDQIQTGRDTHVRISLKEQGDTIELHSFSFFKVAVGEENIDKMVLPIGKARFKVKARTGVRKKRFRVKTGNALVGVKGTEWVMSSGEGDTSVLTISGIVSLANILAPDISVDIPNNQASRIEQNKLPTAPVVVPPEVREQVVASDSRNSFQVITYGSPITVPKEEQQRIRKKSQSGDEKQSTGDKKEGGDSDEKQGGEGGEPAETSGEGGQETPGEGDAALETDAPGDDYASVDFDEPELEEPEIDIDEIIDEITEIESDIAEEQAAIEIEAIEIQVLH